MSYRPLTTMEHRDMLDFFISVQQVDDCMVQLYFKLADETAQVQEKPVFDILFQVKLALGEKYGALGNDSFMNKTG
jgi:hypothetical protein